MQLPGMVKKRGSVVSLHQIWTQQHNNNNNNNNNIVEQQQQQKQLQHQTQPQENDHGSDCDDNTSSIIRENSIDLDDSLVGDSPSFSTIDENDCEMDDDQNDINGSGSSSSNEITQLLLVPLQQRRNTTVVPNTSLSPLPDKVLMSTTTMMIDPSHNSNCMHIYEHQKAPPSTNSNNSRSNNSSSTVTTKYPALSSAATATIMNKGGVSTSSSSSMLPLYRHPSPKPTFKDVQQVPTTTSRIHATNAATTVPTAMAQTKAMQLLVGAAGIYAAYLYYGVVQEDLFRYRSISGVGFSYVWALQVLESAVTMIIGYIGRKLCGGRKNLPLLPFFHSGVSQLAAKALMSLSLAAGLSFPVVVLAKSAKIVPVMIGQLVLGGSKYSFHDYLFAFMIVAGTSLLSTGNTTEDVVSGSDTFTGLILITLSLTADGFTGGLQKKLKRVTASMAPTTYDFLFYSHVAQFCAAILVCFVSGEIYTAPIYLMENPTIWWWIGASCVCSAVGQCFIFYVISCFDPVVCTTITTTRKMLTVVFSISFKGHHLSSWGYIGLGLAVSALLLEVEAKYAQFRRRQKGMVEIKLPSTANLLSSNASAAACATHQPLVKSLSASSVPLTNGNYTG